LDGGFKKKTLLVTGVAAVFFFFFFFWCVPGENVFSRRFYFTFTAPPARKAALLPIPLSPFLGTHLFCFALIVPNFATFHFPLVFCLFSFFFFLFSFQFCDLAEVVIMPTKDHQYSPNLAINRI
jgi:hypothetical protein